MGIDKVNGRVRGRVGMVSGGAGVRAILLGGGKGGRVPCVTNVGRKPPPGTQAARVMQRLDEVLDDLELALRALPQAT